MIQYVDTSAALKLLVEEQESEVLASSLSAAARGGDDLVSSMLLWTELHCAAQRRDFADAQAVNDVIDGITLVDVTRGDLLRAGSSAWGLRSADAIHLAVALRLESDAVVTYDREFADAATASGLTVLAPTT